MRNLLDIVAEATKTKEPVTIDLSIEEPTSHGELTTAKPDAGTPTAVEPPGRRASAAQTRASIKAPNNPAAAMRHLSDLLANAGDVEDEISDEEAARIAGRDGDVTDGYEPIPPTPQNLPAILSRAVAETGEHLIVPEWHMVRNLSGYAQRIIRMIGRDIFRQFTNTPLEDIQVLATLSNSDEEVNGMANWIRQNAVKDDEVTLDFGAVMPGYTAKGQLWNAFGYTFLLVRDQMGNYIYAWPGGRGVHVGHTDFQRLR